MNRDISILRIVEDTVVDGSGFRTAIYAAGCANRCVGCHNPQSWKIENGERFSVETILEKIKSDPFSNVTFSGGDPFFQVEAFTELAARIKSETRKDIWCYTGYEFEQIQASPLLASLLPYVDVLVDGRFEESLKQEGLLFRGSTNQRLIDVPASLQTKRVVTYQPDVSL